jgi:hypothetical protein
MSYRERPVEAFKPAHYTGLDRLPTRWSRRVRVAGLVVAVCAGEWALTTLSIVTAHAVGLV